MSENITPIEWITTVEAAELTGYSRVAFQVAQDDGRLYSVKRGHTRFFKKSDILAYVAHMQTLGNKKHTPKRYRSHEQDLEISVNEVNTIDENFNPLEWITTIEAAKLTGYSRHTFQKAYQKGQLCSVKRGNNRFFKKEEVLDYAARMQALGSQKHTPKQFQPHDQNQIPSSEECSP